MKKGEALTGPKHICGSTWHLPTPKKWKCLQGKTIIKPGSRKNVTRRKLPRKWRIMKLRKTKKKKREKALLLTTKNLHQKMSQQVLKKMKKIGHRLSGRFLGA